MQRIAADGHINNRFTDGNPQAGQEATIVSAAWLNSVQEEVARTIELSGIALDAGSNEQLYNALVALVAGAVGNSPIAPPPVSTAWSAAARSTTSILRSPWNAVSKKPLVDGL